jgi:sulfonate transport system permease protein
MFSIRRTITAVLWRVAPVIVPLAMLALWELVTRFEAVPGSLIATPTDVVQALVKMLQDHTLLSHSIVSLQRLFGGFALGALPAFCMGMLTGYYRWAERFLTPTVHLLAPVPVTAWIPIVIIIAGIGELSKAVVIAIGAFFPVYYGTFNGIRSADVKFLEVARLYDKTPQQVLRHVLLPSALPHILRSMTTALTLGWILLVVAEVIASSEGLGWLMWYARNFGRPDQLIVGMITTGVLGALTTGIFVAAERHFSRWRPAYQGQ